MWLALLPQSKEVLESIPSFSVWSVQILWVHGLKHQVRSPVSALDQGSGVGRCMMSGMGQMQRANFIILLRKYKVLQETFTWFEFSTAHNSDKKRWWDIFKTGLTILFFFFLGGPLLYLNGKPCAKRKHLLYHIVLLRCNMVLWSQFSSLEWLPAQSVTLPTMLRSWKNELGSQCLKKMFAFFSLEISGPFIWGDKWDSLRRVQRKGQQGWFKIDFKLCESFSIRNAITPILKGSPAKKKAWAGSGSRAVIHQSERRLFNPWPQQSTCQSVLVLNLKLLPSARSVSVPMNGAPDEWWR